MPTVRMSVVDLSRFFYYLYWTGDFLHQALCGVMIIMRELWCPKTVVPKTNNESSLIILLVD